MEHGYFFIGDVLGFKKIVTNSKESTLNGKVDSWLRLVDDATTLSKSRIKPQLISDTVFLKAGPGPTGLKVLIAFARHLLNEGIRQSILVKGAITHGPYEWGKLTYGKAVIAAHELEMSQDWIGVACSDLPDADECWGHDGLVCYPPPFKAGPIKLHPCVVWNVPEADALISASTAFPLMSDTESLQNEWRRRLRNTADFGSYLNRAALLRDWKSYHGDKF